MILEAHNLTFYYRNRKKNPIIDSFELTISPGERVGLKGSSGRGKTTLCRLLAGYERPKRGQVLLDGKQLDPLNYFSGDLDSGSYGELLVYAVNTGQSLD